MNHKFILFNMYKLLQWRVIAGMEFFINLILKIISWSCYVQSLVQIEQIVRKLRRKYLCSYFQWLCLSCKLSLFLPLKITDQGTPFSGCFWQLSLIKKKKTFALDGCFRMILLTPCIHPCIHPIIPCRNSHQFCIFTLIDRNL